jgi:hypothetical protein
VPIYRTSIDPEFGFRRIEIVTDPDMTAPLDPPPDELCDGDFSDELGSTAPGGEQERWDE